MKKMYRFDEIAENVNIRVMPGDTDLDRYVGLEHLDPNSLKIQNWGSPEEVIGQKLRFWKGDIVYGRRRAYQRKLAVADFDGICSAHAMVLRAKAHVCLPEFLPFFLQGDIFHERAIEISVGSLSPTINWRTLAMQKFSLPPLDEQRRLAEFLWAADEATQRYREMIRSLDQLTSSCRDSFFNDRQGCRREQLGDLFQIKLGKMVSPKSRKGISPKPFISNVNVQWGRIDLSGVRYMDFSDEEFEKNRLLSGDLLVCEGGEVGRSAIWKDDLPECGYQKAIHRLRPTSPDLMPETLLHFMHYAARRRLFAKYTGQSTIAHLPAERLRLVEVPVPPHQEQFEFLSNIAKIQTVVLSAHAHLSRTHELSRKLLEDVLQVS